MKVKSIVLAALLILGVTTCQKDDSTSLAIKFNPTLEQSFVNLDLNVDINSNALKSTDPFAWVTTLNGALMEHGIQLAKMETYGAEQEGVTVIFKSVGNKQLDLEYLPNDPRNNTGTTVPYLIDGTEMGTASGMTAGETHDAIVSAMNTWDDITCSSGLDIPSYGVADFDIGYVQWLSGFGGIPGYFPGVIAHAGILPGAFSDWIASGGSSSILGVTFTFVYVEDLDNNGIREVAFKEVYINNSFNWQDAPDDVLGNGIYDFETAVLHEVGHGLNQAHFGKAIITPTGKLRFAPYALMNSSYSIARREVIATDLAGHCSIWAEWPNN